MGVGRWLWAWVWEVVRGGSWGWLWLGVGLAWGGVLKIGLAVGGSTLAKFYIVVTVLKISTFRVLVLI